MNKLLNLKQKIPLLNRVLFSKRKSPWVTMADFKQYFLIKKFEYENRQSFICH
jgi:hypothetical protein